MTATWRINKTWKFLVYTQAFLDQGRGTDCSDGLLLANDNDCSTYYECVQGRYELRICPQGTSFDPLVVLFDGILHVIKCSICCYTHMNFHWICHNTSFFYRKKSLQLKNRKKNDYFFCGNAQTWWYRFTNYRI